MGQCRRSYESGTASLSDLLMQSVHRLASDPRDKVFSLFGLISPSFVLSFKADYSMSIKEVYKKTAKACIERDQVLTILRFAGLGSKDSGMPSWTPDWRRAPTISNRIPPQAKLSAPKTRALVSGSEAMDELVVCGTIIGRVSLLEHELTVETPLTRKDFPLYNGQQSDAEASLAIDSILGATSNQKTSLPTPSVGTGLQCSLEVRVYSLYDKLMLVFLRSKNLGLPSSLELFSR